MACEHDQNSEYQRSRQQDRSLDSHIDSEADMQHHAAGVLPGLAGLMRSTGIGARCNAPVRAQAMQQVQRTHGNRAVQRQISGAPIGASASTQGSALDEDIVEYNQARLGYNDAGGVGFGWVGQHREGSVAGKPASMDTFFEEGDAGTWYDGDAQRWGARRGSGLGRAKINEGGEISADAGVLTAGAEASIGENGATVGGGFNIVEGSITSGKFDKGRNIDEQGRYGLSAGPSLAGRMHWADSDGDGHREYGAGFDFGPFSVDVKTEDPLRTATKLGVGKNLPGSGGGAGSRVRDLLRHMPGYKPTDEPANWTDTVLGSFNPMELGQAELARRSKQEQDERINKSVLSTLKSVEDRKRAIEGQLAEKATVDRLQEALLGGAAPKTNMDSGSDPFVPEPAPLWE